MIKLLYFLKQKIPYMFPLFSDDENEREETEIINVNS
jgi:hypothetical protein